MSVYNRAPLGDYPSEYRLCDDPVDVAAPRAQLCGCRSGRRSFIQKGGSAALNLQTLRDESEWVQEALAPAAKMVTVMLPSAPEAEAHAAAALLIGLATHWKVEGAASGVEAMLKEVLVVAPHHKQHAALRRALMANEVSRPLAKRISIYTAEKVQGQEADIVLVLYGLTDRTAIAAEAEFLYSARRLNVALTRGRTKTMLLLSKAVLHPDALDASADDGWAAIRRMHDTCKRGSDGENGEPAAGSRLVEMPLPSGMVLEESQRVSQLAESLSKFELDAAPAEAGGAGRMDEDAPGQAAPDGGMDGGELDGHDYGGLDHDPDPQLPADVHEDEEVEDPIEESPSEAHIMSDSDMTVDE